MKIYTPTRLIEELEYIKQKHPISDKELLTIEPSDALKRLVEMITAIPPHYIKQKAYSLSYREALFLIGYIPQNYYHVKLDNLFDVFLYRADKNICTVFFSEWQNAYDNPECNMFIQKIIHSYEPLLAVFIDYHYTESMVDDMLNAASIPSWFGRHCIKFDNTSASFEQQLAFYGIHQETKLYKDIQYLFYTYCHKKDYLEVQKGKLLTIVEQYILDKKNVLLFLINFLTELGLGDLRQFSDLARVLERKTGTNGTEKQRLFFENISKEIWIKYRNWLNLIHINEYFGNDERSRFWVRYEFKIITRFNFSNSVAMETEKYYIVEFLGKAMGPMYIFTKDVFQQKIMPWMKTTNNNELRQQLYHSELYIKRMTHQGDWQSEFDWYIRLNRIAPRIL